MPIALQLGRLKREHMQKEKCKLIHAPISWFQDCFFRSKSAQSSKNHAAYKRRHGRQGSATLPQLPPILAKLANETIMNSLNFSACYHNPASCAPTPLRRDTMLESFADGIFTDSHIDAMNCHIHAKSPPALLRASPGTPIPGPNSTPCAWAESARC
jgi:hypothetical protein